MWFRGVETILDLMMDTGNHVGVQPSRREVLIECWKDQFFKVLGDMGEELYWPIGIPLFSPSRVSRSGWCLQ